MLRPDFYLQVPIEVYNRLPETMRSVLDTGEGNKNYLRMRCDSGDFRHTNLIDTKTEIKNGYRDFYTIVSPRQLKLEITLRETRYSIYQALKRTQEIVEATWETNFPQVLEFIDTVTPEYDDDDSNGGSGQTLRYGILSISDSLTSGNYNTGSKRRSTEQEKIKFCFYELPDFS